VRLEVHALRHALRPRVHEFAKHAKLHAGRFEVRSQRQTVGTSADDDDINHTACTLRALRTSPSIQVPHQQYADAETCMGRKIELRRSMSLTREASGAVATQAAVTQPRILVVSWLRWVAGARLCASLVELGAEVHTLCPKFHPLRTVSGVASR